MNPLIISRYSLILRRCMNSRLIGIQTLFTPSALGIDRFKFSIEKKKNQFKNGLEEFQKYFENSAANEDPLYSEDLKSMLYLCENEEEHLECLRKVCKKYARNNADVNEIFQFGPELMRLYFLYNIPDEAKKALEDDEMKRFFIQSSSFTIYMTLLYNCGLYTDIVKTMNQMLAGDFHATCLSKNCTTLTMAAYYKMNAQENVESAIALLNRVECLPNTVKIVDPRALCLLAMLALKKGFASHALEIVSRAKEFNSLTENIKAEVWAQLGEADNAFCVIKTLTSSSSSGQFIRFDAPVFVLAQTMDAVEVVLRQRNKKESLSELESIRLNLPITKILHKRLEDVLLQPIGREFKKNEQTERVKRFISAGYNRENKGKSSLERDIYERRLR